MTGFIVTTHGDLCFGIKSASEMIGCTNQNTEFFSLSNDGMETFEKDLGEVFARMHGKFERLIVFTDLFGATPYNTARRIIHDRGYNDVIVTGINLGSYMETELSSTFIEDTDELAQKALEAGQNGVMLITPEDNPGETAEIGEDDL